MATLRDVSASVHQRLLNRSRESERPFNELLQYYAMERFLYRLSQSEYVDRFILKGALLFRVWMVPDSRATRDMDFLAYVDNSVDGLIAIARDIIAVEVTEDGLIFDPGSVKAQRIKEDADYEGVRIHFNGLLGNARVKMQIDVGFGDVVHPAATEDKYPTLLDHPAPVLRIYPPETVIAEKIEAMLYLGALNSRMKDFYDVWRLSQQQSFDGESLLEALKKTLNNRSTSVFQFSKLFSELTDSSDKQEQWTAFVNKSMVDAPKEFVVLLKAIGVMISPMLEAVSKDVIFGVTWSAGGPWK
ncbi:MAG: nucleotidyl transferase AbiEii/AbiGii toxin family protein [Gammaproteobacteria bacterium]